MDVINRLNPTGSAMKDFFGAPEDGPFVMVNLLKFKDKAEYADGSDADLSGRDAYMRYSKGVMACLAAVGGTLVYSGAVTGLMIGEVEENWEMIALVQYPTLDAMKTMLMSPEYQAIAVHRTAGLAGQLNIKTKAYTKPAD